jgi:hypothetical protein
MLTIICALLLVAFGYGVAFLHRRWEWRRLQELRQLVHGEMSAMQQVTRINDAYFAARDQLRRR